MKIHIVQLDDRVPPGLVAEFLEMRGVNYQVVRPCAGDLLPHPQECRAVIMLGGYMSVTDTQAYPFLQDVKAFIVALVERNIPYAGICLGGQLLAEVLGGRVISGRCGERGLGRVQMTDSGTLDPLFAGIPPVFTSFQWHNDSFDPPSQATALAFSENCPGQAFRLGNAYGLQFHPEVDRNIVQRWSGDTGLVVSLDAVVGEFRYTSFRLWANFLKIAGF